MKKILIFGSSGFVGKNLFNYITDNTDYRVQGFNSTDCNLLDYKKVTYTLKEYNQIDFIVNATHFEVNSNKKYSNNYLQDNLKMTYNLLYACKELKNPKKIIFLGSGLEYGNSKDRIDENHTLNPLNAYATSKALNSVLTLSLGRDLELPVVLIRPFNLYGKYDTRSVIYYLLNSLYENKNVSLSEGKQVKDYLYIDDFSEAIVKIMGSSESFPNYEVFNIGSGQGVTLKKIFSIIYTLLDKQMIYDVIPYRNNEYYYQIANINKFINLVPWVPQTNLEKGIKKTIAWIQGESI